MIPTSRRLEYASGYLELGMLEDASDELKMIEGSEALSADVMRMRIGLYHQAKNWDLLAAVASALTRLAPNDDQGWISWAYATRRLQGVAGAQEVLLKAIPLRGDTCAVLHYNLACYACLLGHIEEAKRRLSTALKMDPQFKATALDDPDLETMRPEIPNIE